MLTINPSTHVYPPVAGWASLPGLVVTGDILLCAGKSGISRAISAVTDSEVTHVGMLYNTGSSIRVVEAVGRVRDVDLHDAYRDYDGDLYIGRLMQSPYDIKRLSQLMQEAVGAEYDWDDLVKIMVNSSWLARKLRIHFKKDMDKRFYCSDHIASVLRAYYGDSVPAGYRHLVQKGRYSTPRSVAELCTVRWCVV